MKNVYRKRILFENILICLLGTLAIIILVLSFFPSTFFFNHFAHLLAMKKMTARIMSIFMLTVMYNLYARKKVAWYITVLILFLDLVHCFIPPHIPALLVLGTFYALCLIVFLLFRTDFQCASEHRSLRQAFFFLLSAIFCIFLNAIVSYHFLKLQLSDMPKKVVFWNSIQESFGILFGTTNNNARGFPNLFFENFMFWFSWGCILFALLYSLHPWIERFLWTEKTMQHARALVLKYGQNPASYLTLEDDKLLYFAKCVEGVLPYGVVHSTVIVNGDPICATSDFPAFLDEFRNFCQKNNHKLIFLSITGEYLEEYRKQGFETAKCGEEACFDIQNYTITGKKGAKMRMNINHATNAGLTVHEYKPLEKRDPEIENSMNRITDEWIHDKKSSLLTFTLGTTGLDRPLDKRYFYASDASGHIYGYNVFCPYNGMTGYMADITRRSYDAPSGVTEKIMYEAMQTFKAEGIKTVSMGLAPLANIIQEGEPAGSTEKLLHFVYEHLNSCYGFKNLYHAKESYSPTDWLPGYYAWFPGTKIPAPEMFYAIARIQNKEGMIDYVKAFLTKRGS